MVCLSASWFCVCHACLSEFFFWFLIRHLPLYSFTWFQAFKCRNLGKNYVWCKNVFLQSVTLLYSTLVKFAFCLNHCFIWTLWFGIWALVLIRILHIYWMSTGAHVNKVWVDNPACPVFNNLASFVLQICCLQDAHSRHVDGHYLGVLAPARFDI